MYFRIEVSFPLSDDMLAGDEKVEKIAGMKRSDSGAGFGMRDVAFVVETQPEAGALIKRLLDGGYIDIACSTHRRD